MKFKCKWCEKLTPKMNKLRKFCSSECRYSSNNLKRKLRQTDKEKK